MATCTLCNAKMMPSSLTPHMYIRHNKESPVTTTVDPAVIIPKSKRAAASRQVQSIAKLVCNKLSDQYYLP